MELSEARKILSSAESHLLSYSEREIAVYTVLAALNDAEQDRDEARAQLNLMLDLLAQSGGER